MDRFSEEEMGSGLHGSAKSAHCSLHGLCLETLLNHDGDHFPEDKGLRDTTGISQKAENHGQVERKEEKGG